MVDHICFYPRFVHYLPSAACYLPDRVSLCRYVFSACYNFPIFVNNNALGRYRTALVYSSSCTVSSRTTVFTLGPEYQSILTSYRTLCYRDDVCYGHDTFCLDHYA